MTIDLDAMCEQSESKIYLKALREHLWSHNMSIMVGAGFSRNAIPTFPLWETLASELAKKLTLDNKTYSGTDVPRLAGAYAKCHKLPALIQFIETYAPKKNSIPDLNLHTSLLNLPWTDVFTTNYDTLLEDSQESLLREYKIISSEKMLAIPRQNRCPRIIKLHGSFFNLTSNNFVITEEHYRTYRTKHAPFVNTIRQSLIEGAMCLVGYSGNDPDFLEWTGWVRDTLDGEQNPIYILTLDKLTPVDQAVYDLRGITPINISAFCAIQEENPLGKERNGYVPESQKDRYKEAYTNFLRWLHKGKPTNEEEIDKRDNVYVASATNALTTSEVQSNNANNIYDEKVTWEYPHFYRQKYPPEPITREKIQEVVGIMQKARGSYPDSIVPNITTLNTLWSRIECADKFLDSTFSLFKQSKATSTEFLQPIYEVCWLLDKSMAPPFKNVKKYIGEILKAHYPPLIKKKKNKTQQKYAVLWLHSALLLVRWARQAQDMASMAKWSKKISKLLALYPDPEVQEAVTYQNILSKIQSFDRKKALKLTESWKIHTKASPLWHVKKAMLYTELGNTSEGFSLLNTTYKKLHKKIVANKKENTLFLRSTACIAAHHLAIFKKTKEYILIPSLNENKKLTKKITETAIATLPSNQDNAPDIAALLSTLSDKLALTRNEIKQRPAFLKFDLGNRDTSVHVTSGFKKGIKEAFQAIGVLEVIGSSPYIKGIAWDSHIYLHASQVLFHVQQGITSMACGLLFRSAPSNIFATKEDIFLRYYLAKLEDNDVHRLAQQLYHGLQDLLFSSKSSKSFVEESFISFGLELLGRLCIRITKENLYCQLLDLALNILKSGYQWSMIGKFNDANDFCHRVVSSSPHILLQRYIPQLLESPVLLGYKDLEEAPHFFLYSSKIDIVQAIPHDFEKRLPPFTYDKLAHKILKELETYKAKSIKDDSFEERLTDNIFPRYYLRLLWMIEHNLLQEETLNLLGKTVWKGYEEKGLPLLKGLRPFSILSWPCPKNILVFDRYKQALAEKTIPPAGKPQENGRISYSSAYEAPLYEYLVIRESKRIQLNLTHEDQIQIVANCQKFVFEAKKTKITWEKSHVQSPFLKLVWILSYIVAPSLPDIAKDVDGFTHWFKQVITYGESLGTSPLRLKVLGLLFSDTPKEEAHLLAREIEETLFSKDTNEAREAGFSLLLWRLYVETHVPCPESLASACIKYFWLLGENAENAFSAILEEQFSSFSKSCKLSEEEKELLLKGLEKQRTLLSYKNSEKAFEQEGDRVNEWVKHKEDLELLPEKRFAVGKVIVALCKNVPEMKKEQVILDWHSDMQTDPLSEMRQLAEVMDILGADKDNNQKE